MAVRTDVVVDWSTSPRIIRVLSPSVEISMQDLIDTIRHIEASLPEGMQYDHLIDAAGKENLGSGVRVGITVTLRNAHLAFEDRSGPAFVQCNISGGNLVAVDDVGADLDPVAATTYTQIVRTSSSSATITDVEKIEYAGAVHIDTINGRPGMEYPVGTDADPVDNMTDARTIADKYGIDMYHIHGSITLNADHRDWGFDGATEDAAVNIAGYNVNNSHFIDVELSGQGSGRIHAKGCRINGFSGIAGDFDNCGLLGINAVAPGETPTFIRCYSRVPGTNTPSISLQGASTGANIRAYSGGLKIENVSDAGSNITIELIAGRIVIAASCTAGTIVCRGVGVLDDQSAGAVVDRSALVEGESISDLHDEAFGKWVLDPAGKTLTLYRKDGSTILKVFDLTDTQQQVPAFIGRMPQ